MYCPFMSTRLTLLNLFGPDPSPPDLLKFWPVRSGMYRGDRGDFGNGAVLARAIIDKAKAKLLKLFCSGNQTESYVVVSDNVGSQ